MPLQKHFTKKTAKAIAKHQFGYIRDSMLGISDPHYNLKSSPDFFRENIEEDLESEGFVATPHKVDTVKKELQIMIENALIAVEKILNNPI